DAPSQGFAQSTGAEAEAVPAEDDGMVVEGTLGTLPESDVRAGIENNFAGIARCFERRYGAVDVLGGEFEMSFRIKADGSVRWVFLRRSTVGDRATERCLLGVLARISFARPRGGEAEVTTSLALEPAEDIRPPVAWPASRVASAVRRADLAGRCDIDTDGLSVTAYVAPGGRVLAAGAAVDQLYEGVDGGAPGLEAALDCIAEGVAALSMPDPGSYPAKVTFGL